jgi:hypothetical protein
MKNPCRSIGVCWLLVLATLFTCSRGSAAAQLRPDGKASDTVFLVKPYLQLGDAPPGMVAKDLTLLWQTDSPEAGWVVEYRVGTDAGWRESEAPRVREISVPTIAPHWLHQAALKNLNLGEAFAYRVRKGGNVVFSATSRAPRASSQPYRFVAFGDCGAATAEQKAVAYQAHLARPDFIMITGDIVYSRGRISEYRDRFWTIYNADEASPVAGAPLLRSTLFLAAPGNHDIATRDLEKYPDALAYFLYWDQPRNGPADNGAGVLGPPLTGPSANKQAFHTASAGSYPRMANFSFEYGNTHWLVLDSNPYVDWTNREIRAWVERDLSGAEAALWRFVAFHHPGFNSAKTHFDDQQMRLLADIFEARRVDVVFSGHVHNYQRTFPLCFDAERTRDGKLIRDENRVPGHWRLDKLFDGQTRTRPQGVIYLITGAGGNKLYDPEQQDDPGSWQPFTHQFISKIHSLTVADVDGRTLTVRQVSGEGQELDRFIVTK